MRVLVYTEAWGSGGIETFVSGEVRCLSNSGMQFDVFSTWCWKGYKQRGLHYPNVTHTVAFSGFRPNLVKRTLIGCMQFSRLLRSNSYDAVHINTMNGMGFLYSAAARCFGVPVRIVHSHNSDYGTGARRVKAIMHFLGKALFMSSATKLIACSNSAGKYMFGDKDYEVIPNGIDTKKYCFDNELRKQTREALGIPQNTVLVGSVGRLAPQKNPLFQIEVFNHVNRAESLIHFLMVGSGELSDAVDDEIERLGLKENIRRLEAVDDVAGIYCALDYLIMPSLFEGFPMVVVEAQCSGLGILCSDALTDEVLITDLVKKKNLSDGAEEWAKTVLDLMSRTHIDRSRYAELVSNAGFSIETTSLRIEELLRCDRRIR